VLARVPSHMPYNIVLADRTGAVASVELIPGGGMRRMPGGIATNHQHGPRSASRPGFTRTLERRAHLEVLLVREIAPDALAGHFLQANPRCVTLTAPSTVQSNLASDRSGTLPLSVRR
jgi:hypothetical protein